MQGAGTQSPGLFAFGPISCPPTSKSLFARQFDFHHLIILTTLGIVAPHFERLRIFAGTGINFLHGYLLFGNWAVSLVFPGNALAIIGELAFALHDARAVIVDPRRD